MVTTSNIMFSWCQSQIHPARNSKLRNSISPITSWNVKEVILETLLSWRSVQLFGRICNSATSWTQRIYLLEDAFVLSLRKQNISTECLHCCSTQLLNPGERTHSVMEIYNSFHTLRVIQEKNAQKCMCVHKIIFKYKKGRKKGHEDEGGGKQLPTYKKCSHVLQCWPITVTRGWR